MSDPEPWSLVLRVDQIGQGVTRRLEADADTRDGIARALGLQGLARLSADLEITPQFEGGVLRGRLAAAVTQTCGVTLDPVDSEIDAQFEVLFRTRPETHEPEPGVEMSLSDLDRPDVVADGVLDLGRYVVEHLALELDPFPRKPGAEFAAPTESHEPSPFAVLSAFKRDTPAR